MILIYIAIIMSSKIFLIKIIALNTSSHSSIKH